LQENNLLILSMMMAAILPYPITVWIEKTLVKKGITAEDMHKKPGRMLPKSGGLGFLIGWSIALIPLLFIENTRRLSIVALAVAWIAGAIGLYDDIHKLEGKTKVILTLLTGLPIIIAHVYTPYLYIPFIGTVTLTIVYPLLIPIALAVSCNAINMMDTFTGIAPSITLVLTLFSGIMIYHNNPTVSPPLLLSIITTLSLSSYLPRNLYPGKTFNGDTGTLAWGGILALIGITGRIEAFLVLSAMPVVTNGFTILASVKGIIEHEHIKVRPTKVDRERNIIKANPDKKAPVTLAHLLTMTTEMRESEIVFATILLVLTTTILSTALLLAIS
jgi:UDP-N-acetylmuramyl pentapeptide phosphotransferase/UDP-N-acetylglucosamine-1-phosphate transferase